MGTVFVLLIVLSVLHYAVVFYATLARRLAGLVIRLAARHEAVGSRRGGGGEDSGQDWPQR